MDSRETIFILSARSDSAATCGTIFERKEKTEPDQRKENSSICRFVSHIAPPFHRLIQRGEREKKQSHTYLLPYSLPILLEPTIHSPGRIWCLLTFSSARVSRRCHRRSSVCRFRLAVRRFISCRGTLKSDCAVIGGYQLVCRLSTIPIRPTKTRGRWRDTGKCQSYLWS